MYRQLHLVIHATCAWTTDITRSGLQVYLTFLVKNQIEGGLRDLAVYAITAGRGVFYTVRIVSNNMQ